MICACGKAAMDGKRCKLGATHELPPPRKPKFEEFESDEDDDEPEEDFDFG